MKTLVRIPTRDPLMRAYRLNGTAPERPTTIHDIVRRQTAERARAVAPASGAQATYPWWATR